MTYDKDELTAADKALLGKCGVFCGACDSYLGKSRSMLGKFLKIWELMSKKSEWLRIIY